MDPWAPCLQGALAHEGGGWGQSAEPIARFLHCGLLVHGCFYFSGIINWVLAVLWAQDRGSGCSRK